MAENNIVAKNISELISVATTLRRDWFPQEASWWPWFRGHSGADWKLSPKLYRYGSPKRGIRIIEDEIRQEFIMRAPSLSDARPQNTWEWYFTMQHSGAPTRLLDWTEGALIAAYFAVRDNKGDVDAAVWALDPWWLNKFVVGEREVVPPGAEIGISPADAERYKPWLPDRYSSARLHDLAVAIYPTHSVRRISTQRSCFTIHGSEVDGLEKLAGHEDAHLVKIVLPRTDIPSIREQLLVSGVDEITIFPDLDGLGRYLTTVLLAETQSK